MPPRRPLPFFYGWVIVATAFMTMAVAVNARTAFSLLFPPILDEFGWARGVTAAAFAVGFLGGTLYAPFIGILMDRLGPRVLFPAGILLVSAGLALATAVRQPWQLYATLGVLVTGGSMAVSTSGTRSSCRPGDRALAPTDPCLTMKGYAISA